MVILEQTATRYQAIVRKAFQAFFSPPQYEERSFERQVILRGVDYRVPFDDGELAVTSWGESGPAVLLMHGWGGSRAQMTGFVSPLLSAGYRIVAYDQPAHGESDGKMTNLLEIAPTIDIILKKEGRFDAIIAHSFGTLIVSYALVNRNFPSPSKLVYFGAFNRLLDSLPRFQVLAGLSDEIMIGLSDMINETFGKDVLDAIVNEQMTRHIHIPALMFHDTADSVTPNSDSRAIAKAWKSAQLVETTGLGHRGGLQSKEVHEQIVRFLES